MTITIADLQARVTAVGTDQAAQQVKAVGDAATQTARALEIMAQQASKAGTFQGSSVAQIMDIFKQGNVQPTAQAMAQAAQEMQKTATAAQTAGQATQTVARAATEHAAAARSGAHAAQGVAEGWKASESSIVRFGAGLAGIGLGISIVAGAARLIHDTIVSTVDAQLDWERSLVQVQAIYGNLAPQIVALSQAQAALPGVTATQGQLLQTNIAAGFLTTRYGVSPTLTGSLTTQAARLGGLFGMAADQQQALQGAFINYAQTGSGGALEQATGQPFDSLTLARRLGFSSENALQALTPQQLTEARTQLGIATAAQLNIRGGDQQRGLLDAQRELQHNLEQAQANLQNSLENVQQGSAPPGTRSELAQQTNFPLLQGGPAYTGTSLVNVPPDQVQAVAAQQAVQRAADAQRDYQKAVDDAKAALDANTQALADNQKQLDDANAALAKFGISAGSAAARLLSFTGSLEDTFSIARGDVGEQAQSAVASRARSAIPGIGTPTAEINYTATQTAYQQAYQNYVAQQAQATQDNAVRDFLQAQANQQGPGLENQRAAAQRALTQAAQAQPVQQAMGEAQKTQAQIDLAAQERQAELDTISLNQEERRLEMMRETVQLRIQDNQLQQQSTAATMEVIRAQQTALPAERTASAAQYGSNLAQALAQRRMALALQGKDVSGEPSIDSLIQMNQQSVFAQAENAPALVRAERGVEVAGQNATQVSLTQALTDSQIHLAELSVDGQNLKELPQQTQYQQELNEINRAALQVQAEQRDLLKQLVTIMSGQPASAAGGVADQSDRIARQAAAMVFGTSTGSIAAPPDLAANRRGPV